MKLIKNYNLLASELNQVFVIIDKRLDTLQDIFQQIINKSTIRLSSKSTTLVSQLWKSKKLPEESSLSK